MKFTLFFIILNSYLISLFLNHDGNLRFIILWVIINFTFMILAYALNKPNLILGKKKNGNINSILLFINLPWLLLTWTIFKIQILLSKESFADQIGETNIWISRRPTSKDLLENFDLVVDLTAEFFKDKTKNYICYPNLDGHRLINLPILTDFDTNQRILIHCANGHGRSALFTSIILKEKRISPSIQEALGLILQSRELAMPNRSQTNWIIKRKD